MKVEDQREVLETWYEAIRSQDLDEANNWKKRFDARSGLFTEPAEKKFFALLNLRYYLMREDYNSAEEMLANLHPEEEKYNLLNYYYYFFKGIYHYDQQEYQKAIEHYAKAKLFTSDIKYEEAAEFYYKFASAYQRNYEITQSSKCAEKALDIFRLKNNHKRIVACENLLGINNKDIGQFKEAELHYHNALISADKSRDRFLKLMTLHNYGVLASIQNDPENALKLLSRAKKLIEPWENRFKVQNLYLIAKNHFKMDQFDLAIHKVKFALMVSEQSDFPDFYHHCKMLQAKYKDTDYFVEGYKKGIAFFYDHKRWDYVNEYGEELATYFRKEGFHEQCGEYYGLSSLARNKIKEERGTPHV